MVTDLTRRLLLALIFVSCAPHVLAADCYHGNSDQFVGVEICRENPTGCLSICIAADAWDTPAANATLFRHIVAVSDDAMSYEDVASALPLGIRPGTRERLGVVTVYTEKLSQLRGKIY